MLVTKNLDDYLIQDLSSVLGCTTERFSIYRTNKAFFPVWSRPQRTSVFLLSSWPYDNFAGEDEKRLLITAYIVHWCLGVDDSPWILLLGTSLFSLYRKTTSRSLPFRRSYHGAPLLGSCHSVLVAYILVLPETQRLARRSHASPQTWLPRPAAARPGPGRNQPQINIEPKLPRHRNLSFQWIW